MRIVAFIPARYESKRFQGKPLAMIACKPMIQRVFMCAISCREISEVFVATDDERIFRCVEDFGGKAILTGEENPTGTDRVAEASRKIDLDEDDIIINVQGDQPLFQPELISDLIAPIKENRDISISTLIYRIRDESEIDNPNHVKVVTDKEGFALYFSRSPIPFFSNPSSIQVYFKHLGFYAYRPDFLRRFAGLPMGRLESAEKIEPLRVLEHGFRIKVVETGFDSIEIDTPADIEKVEKMIKEKETLSTHHDP